jgi:hypothetical protein
MFAIFPNTTWAQSHATFALIISIAFVVIGGAIAIIFWWQGLKEGKIKKLIKSIPTVISNMNLERGKMVVNILEHKDEYKIDNITNDLWLYFTGIKIEPDATVEKTLKPLRGL